jgi:hypothetical protein
MKYISALFAHFRPVAMLFSTVLVTVLFFSSGLSALAAQSMLTKGTVQLNKIEAKTQEAIDSPAMTAGEIAERAKGGLNEVQGSADRNKMYRSSDEELPVVKQAEKAIQKMKSK